MGKGGTQGGGVGGEPPFERQPVSMAVGGYVPKDTPARIHAGEYVVPADVVQRKGLDFFEALEEKQRKRLTGGSSI